MNRVLLFTVLIGSICPSYRGAVAQTTAPSAGVAADASLLVSSEDKTAPLTTSTTKEWFGDAERDMNPANDGWDTELFSEQTNQQLKHLAEILKSKRPPVGDRLSALITNDFSCTPLLPANLQEVFADRSITVFRPRAFPTAATHQGAEGLAQAIAKLMEGLENATDKYVKFKLFRVTPLEDQVETICLFEIVGRVADGARQLSATWQCRWDLSKEPRLVSIQITAFEKVVVRNSNQTLFSDVTSSIFQDIPAQEQQFGHGIDYWRSQLENYLSIFFDGLHGIAIGDVNGDGLDDVYLCEPGGLPNRLFIQTPTGLVKDVSSEAGVNFLDSTRSALLVDFDNDGDQDLVFPAERYLHFYSNDGSGKFSPALKFPLKTQTAYSLAAADYNQDGRLDLYACFYHGIDEEDTNRLPAPIPLHDARTGGPNLLLRNEGNWQFRDVTNDVGLGMNNDRWSYAAVWEDYDNDGDIDLYVANDFGRNNLYRNDQGRFHDVAEQAGAEDVNFGMSASFADYNRDGLMDLYVSNMFSAAGGRITFQPEFQAEGTDKIRTAYQKMARGNSLLKNVGGGSFLDVSDSTNVTMGRWAWGSLFADVNNDGWEDILVANGFVTGHLPGDL